MMYMANVMLYVILAQMNSSSFREYLIITEDRNKIYIIKSNLFQTLAHQLRSLYNSDSCSFIIIYKIELKSYTYL
jgi:hypothetical protein